jgi:hypothetical protein
VGVQVGLHGNLNDITGWRPRNPLARRFDLGSALADRHPRLRYLVLEPSILVELARLAPRAAERTDVLPLPVNTAEMPARPTAPLSVPLRIGFVGQGTAAKGFDQFLALARDVRARHGDRVVFHHVGRLMPGEAPPDLAVLADPPSREHLPRDEFTRRLAALHYVLLPFREGGYYGLSASGALMDAITWLKPVIATRLPLVEHFFTRYGEIGFACDGGTGLAAAVEAALALDAPGYDRQVAAVQRARAARMPEALARDYCALVARGFPGLLA